MGMQAKRHRVGDDDFPLPSPLLSQTELAVLAADEKCNSSPHPKTFSTP